MSFNDLERGEASQPLLRGVQDEDKTFTSVKDSVSIQIFKVQSNVQGIQRLVDKLGTQADGPALRTSLHNLTEATRDMVKKSTEDVKTLASFPAGGPHSSSSSSASCQSQSLVHSVSYANFNPTTSTSTYLNLAVIAILEFYPNGISSILIPLSVTIQASRKTIQTKLSKEFGTALQSFQRVQKLSVEKQRSSVETQKRRVEELVDDELPSEERGSVELEHVQTQQQQHATQQVSTQELEFQETIIAERESEIRDIETGIHELNDIFRDLGTIVEQQGGLIDNIESNITSVAQNTSSAADELTTAHEYQRKAGRRMLCLLLILVVVLGVILLAILS